MKKVLSYARFYDFYALLLFISIFIIGGFGIYPAISSYYEKRGLVSALRTESEKMDQTLRDLRDRRYLNEDIAPYVEGLSRAVPAGLLEDAVVLDLARFSARSGYLLRSLNFSQNVSQSSTRVTASLEGPFRNLEGFVRDLEESPATYIVDAFSLSFPQNISSSSQVISVQLRVFSLKKGVK